MTLSIYTVSVNTNYSITKSTVLQQMTSGCTGDLSDSPDPEA